MKKIVLFIAIAFMGIKALAQAPTSGLVYRQDFTGNFNVTSTLNATSSANTATLTTDEFNNASNAGSFALGQTLEYPMATNTHLQVGNTNAQITISANVYIDPTWLDGVASNQYITFLMSGNSYMRLLKSGGAYYMQCGVFNNNPTANSFGYLGAEGLFNPQNGWNTIIMTYGPEVAPNIGAAIRIYANGVYTGFRTAASAMNQNLGYTVATDKLVLGRATSTSQNFKGKMDRVLIYDRCLTAAEVLAIKTDKPGISNLFTTNVSTTSKTVNYNLNPNGSATTSIVRYGTSPAALTNSVTGGTATGTALTPLTTTLTGLTAGTIYYFQIEATNANGTTLSNIYSEVPTSNLTKFSFDNNLISDNTLSTLVPYSGSATPTFVANRFGQANKAVYINNHILTTTINGLPLLRQDRTVSFWVKKLSDMTHTIFGWGSTTNFGAYGAYLTNGGAAANFVNYAWGAGYDYYGPAPYSTNWEHFTLVYKNVTATSGTVTLFKNGVLLSTTNSTLNTGGTNLFVIGAYPNAQGNTSNMYLDDFTIFNTALTATEVEALYNDSLTQPVAQSTPPTAAASQTFCGPNTVANLAATGTDLKWYNVATGGTPLASTTAIATGFYYVTQTQAGQGESTRVAVGVTVVSNPSAPITVAQGYCNGATVANLISSGTIRRWYNVATGGTPLPTTTILATGNYYVSEVIGTCESARTLSSVTIQTIAPPTAAASQTFCAGTSLGSLVANGIGLAWYGVATGGTFLQPTSLLVTGNYYVSQTGGTSCESARTMVVVTVNPIPAAPTATAQSFCVSATVADLSATGTALKWYNVATGGTVLASTTALATGNYYISQTTATCESARTIVAVTINPIPTQPFATPTQSFCGSGLTVSFLAATGTGLKWYNTAIGGTVLGTTTIIATGNYYVSQTVSTCEGSRTMVEVTVNPIPAAPTATAQSICNSGTVADLTATGTNLKWYNIPSGGTSLATTTQLATGNYYVSQTTATCESARTMVAVTVNTVAAPTAATTQSFCNSATVASLTATGTGIKWYNVATGGTALATTIALTTGNYYVSQTVSTCESARTMVAVTINTIGAPTGNATQSFVTGASISSLVASGTSIQWFSALADALAGTNMLATNSALDNNTTYYAMQTVNGCRSTSALAVTVSVTLSSKAFNTNLKFLMYPNPATDILNIVIENEIKTIEIYSLLGQKVMTENNKQINISGLAKGIYTIRITSVHLK